jgi:hypothetical protein
MKKETSTHTIDLSDLHMSGAAIAFAALLTVLHLYLDQPNKHAAIKPNEIQGLFEREREIHPMHSSYGARAKYATNSGAMS